MIAVAVRLRGAGGGTARVVAVAPFDQSDGPAVLNARKREAPEVAQTITHAIAQRHGRDQTL